MVTRDEIYLAALLHDIGKFWQRADDEWNKTKNFSEQTKRNIDFISRKNQNGYPTHQHAIWTYEFLQRHSHHSLLNKIVNLSAQHHKPDNEDQAIIQLADWWASGIERHYDENEDALKLGKERYKKQPIGNIFSKVSIDNTLAEEKKAFSIRALSIESNQFFPVEFDAEAANSREKYKNLWKEFCTEFEKTLDINDSRAFIETIYYLLKKYCWSIPAATNEAYPLSSLFEHSKVTAAISWCFKVFIEETGENGFYKYQKGDKLKIKDDQLPLMLLCIDLSGIQKFIYNIASRNAAKCLRGRSFYLQMLLQDIAREILHRTGAYQSNIVYSSGGKLFMLLPNTYKINDIIDKAEEEILEKLWDKFEGEIYLCFGKVPFAYQLEIKDESKPRLKIEDYNELKFFGDLWEIATKKAAEKKSNRFIHLLLSKEKYKNLFEPHGEGGEKTICAVTGKELDENKRKFVDDVWFSTDVYEQKIIGEELPGVSYLAFGTEKTFINTKYINLVTDHKLRIEHSNDIKFDRAEILFVLKDKSPDIVPDKTIYKNNTFGFTYFGGGSYPMIYNSIKTFEQLAEGTPLNKLGILRMDVDSLRKLFINGFKIKDEKDKTIIHDYSSFSNYATLSGMLDLFFSGYINTIREENDFRDYVAIIYSGGDDLFAVGRWDKIIDFAFKVQSDFKKFTGREDITISAGIEIVNPKFPISKGALMTGDAEQKSKNHEYNHQKKNALCLFGIPINWDYEFNNVKYWKDKLVEWLKDDIITRGLLMKLIEYYEQWLASGKKDLSWKWNAAYNLARRRSNLKDERKKVALDEIKNLLFTEVNQTHFRFDALAVALRWAELETRK